ncbi:MAG TPA: BON domain-containing protein [Rudaea sp.]
MRHVIRNSILAAAVAIACAGPAMASDSARHDTEQVSNARRETQILTGFSMNTHLHSYDLIVSVEGNRAVLTGAVESGVEKELAQHIAMDADGITSVDNRITVDSGPARMRAVGHERSFGEKVEDATVTATVKSKLLWNSNTNGLDIHVDTGSGKVTLTGHTRNSSEKDLAARLAKDTDGVVAVDNRLVLGTAPAVQAAAPGQDTISDAWITSKVKSSFLFTRGIDSMDIAVTTLDGTVSLSGTVDNLAQRELAVRIARDIRGVKRVEAAGLIVG